jgi:uncharacterized membrane protein
MKSARMQLLFSKRASFIGLKVFCKSVPVLRKSALFEPLSRYLWASSLFGRTLMSSLFWFVYLLIIILLLNLWDCTATSSPSTAEAKQAQDEAKLSF